MEDRSSRLMRKLLTQTARSGPPPKSDRRPADIHDGLEHNTLHSEAGNIDARPKPELTKFLRRTPDHTLCSFAAVPAVPRSRPVHLTHRTFGPGGAWRGGTAHT